MKTKTINTYQFNELSEKAKQKAMEWYLAGEDYSFSWECIVDDAKNIGLTIKQLDGHKFNKGFFVLSASDTANKILVNHGEDCETYKTAREYLDKVLFACRESSKGTEEQHEELCEELEKEFLQSLLEDYRIMLNRDIEYQQSEACIAENIEANEYEFLESGEIA